MQQTALLTNLIAESRLPEIFSRSGEFAPDRLRRQLLGAAASAPIAASFPWSLAAAQPAGQGFEQAMGKRLAQDGVGFAAAQIGAQGLQLYAMGVKRLGEPAVIDTSTLFELGSITKAFVALLFADGVLKRRITFEDAVEDFLPDGLRLRDKAGQPLRLIDLATHRSGLPRMPGNLSRREMADPYAGYSEARLFAFLTEWKPAVERGQRFEYSNLAYGLLSLVLSRQLGLSFDEALRRHVLLPLGLDDMLLHRPLPGGDDLALIGSSIAAKLALAPRMAAGHAERRPAPPWRSDALAGAVGLLGSITSMGRFMQAALGQFDHPLSEAFAMCLQYRTEGEHPLHPFGFGWELSTIVAPDGSRRTLFNQDGATAGFSMSMWLEPARQRAGTVLSNAFIETRSLALKAVDPNIDQDDFNRMWLPAAALQSFAGSYSRDQRYELAVSVRDGRLWMQETAQKEFEMLPIEARRFVGRDGPLEFVFSEGNQSQTLNIVKDGKILPFARLDRPAANKQP